MDLIHRANARTQEQADVMERIQRDGVCPFCSENLSEYHKKDILDEGAHWIITENQWPYEGSKVHLLAIARAHVTSLKDLPAEAGAELLTLFQAAMDRCDISGGTLAMRFGADTPGYASSVSHLHAHLIEPNLSDPDHKGIKFPVSKATQRTES